ncbi:MAG: formimidoylglutamate deiminase [Proteobacteria bacterium]|nr:formimidoylglutamate deiminase [Pseudomonadota bacterium]MDA0994276.1 formimidoylglutamate deiminase [Pseudomonadota bacterium]
MTQLFARKALTSEGWAENVRIIVSDGKISSLKANVLAERGDYVAGIVIPGLANVHSHAFQRVLAGHTEQRGPTGKDNFWTWRARMYALAGRIDASSMRAIARQAYGEMLSTGYTSVAEFHYLHNEPGERTTSVAMFEAIVEAASESGIRLTYVPVLYERAGFTEPEPTKDQMRFALSSDQLIAHYENASAIAAGLAGGIFHTGIGVHSLRAVTVDSLKQVAAVAANDGVPMHIHIAEQKREVDQCFAEFNARPVEWLFDNCDVDKNWCLVHATHIDDREIALIARSGAVVGLCPSTEANLGDGLFPLKPYLEQGGRIAIGSDSHVSINPFEELRWLEYGQRLVSQSRNIAAIGQPQTGRSLFEMAASGGALACGQGGGQLEAGANADLVVLDDDSPMLAGHTTRSYLDALVFSGFTLPIDRVMVNGVWRVVDGRHEGEEAARSAYSDVAGKLLLDEVLW